VPIVLTPVEQEMRVAQPAKSSQTYGEAEQRIVALFADVIGSADDIDATTNFFAAGGASIGALRVIAAIEREFGVTVPPRAFFARPTARDVAVLMNA
jgi:acyl carrier protein